MDGLSRVSTLSGQKSINERYVRCFLDFSNRKQNRAELINKSIIETQIGKI